MPEEPVIVTGGSVTVRLPDAFKEGTGKDGKKEHKHDSGRLKRVEVNGRKVADLNDKDEVRVVYEY